MDCIYNLSWPDGSVLGITIPDTVEPYMYFVNNLPLILFFVFLIVGKILQIWSEYTIHIHLNSI